MSSKKYDLSQVSQETKDEYLQSMIDWHTRKTQTTHASHAALNKLYQEAEVKPKTAREILEEYLASDEDKEWCEEAKKATVAIFKALKVLP